MMNKELLRKGAVSVLFVVAVLTIFSAPTVAISPDNTNTADTQNAAIQNNMVETTAESKIYNSDNTSHNPDTQKQVDGSNIHRKNNRSISQAAVDGPNVDFVSNSEGVVVEGYNVASIHELKNERYVPYYFVDRAEEMKKAHGSPVMLMRSQVRTSADIPVIDPGKSASHRTGKATYSGSFSTNSAGEYEVSINPDFRAEIGTAQWDFISVGDGGASASVSYRLKLINKDTGEVVQSNTQNVAKSKYPEDFDPSLDGMWGEYAKDVGIFTAAELTATKIGIAEPLSTVLFEIGELWLTNKQDSAVTDFTRPVSTTADLEANHQYKWELSLIGDTRTAASEALLANEPFSLLFVYGDISDSSIEQINDKSPSVSASTSSAVVSPGDSLTITSTLRDATGTPTDGDLTYQITSTGTSGALQGSEGDFGTTITAPSSPGQYDIRVTAETAAGRDTATTSFRVSNGAVQANVASVSSSLFPGQVVEQSIKISNPTAAPLEDIKITIDGDIDDWISLRSPASDWQPSKNSFESLSPGIENSKEVIATIEVPSGESADTVSGAINIESGSNDQTTVPVDVTVVEKSEGVTSDDETAYDSDEVRALITDNGDLGDAHTLRNVPFTIDDDQYTRVNDFSSSDVNVDDLSKWARTRISYDVTDGSDASFSIKMNGKVGVATDSYQRFGRLTHVWSTSPYQPDLNMIDRREDGNVIKMKYNGEGSVEIDDVQVKAEKAPIETETFSDELGIQDDKLEDVRSAYIQMELNANSDDRPMQVMINGEKVGTISTDSNDWITTDKISVDPSLVEDRDVEVTLRTETHSEYLVRDVEFHWTYLKPPDIDADLQSGDVQTIAGQEFTITGEVSNDGGETLNDVKRTLSYDDSKLNLISGRPVVDVGQMNPGSASEWSWRFNVVGSGSSTISLDADANEDDETESITVDIDGPGPSISAPSAVETRNNSEAITVTAENTGTIKDTFVLSLNTKDLPAEWGATLQTRSVKLNPGEAKQLQLISQTPTNASGEISLSIESSILSGETDSKIININRLPPQDNTPPETEIIEGPSGIINQTTLTYSWSGTDDSSRDDQLEYSYKLVGLQDSWSDWTTNSTVEYENLQQKEYTFEVRARDSAGNIDSKPASVNTTVASVPTARISTNRDRLEPGETLRLNANRSKDYNSNDSLSYRWTQLNGPTNVINNTIEQKLTEVTVTESGRYVFRLVVSDGIAYDQTTRAVDVQTGPPPVIGTKPPRDSDNDGLYEDVRGDVDFNILDVQALFNNLDNPTVQNNPELFKFQEGGSDKVTILDVQALFNELASPNNPPTANDISLSTTEDSAISATFDSTDPDGDTLTYSVVSGASDGDLSISGESFTYTPDAGFVGNDSFVYESSDGEQSADATVSITVTGSDSGTVVYRTDFESTSPGNAPSGWSANGNEAMAVTDETSTSGNQSLRMTGSSGACWETVAFGDIGQDVIPDSSSIPPSDTINISFDILPGNSAQQGCHDHNGVVKLNTRNDSVYGGKNLKMVEFKPDGTVVGTNGSLGAYDAGAWTDVSITYERQDSGQVALTYYINGEYRDKMTVESVQFAPRLSYFEVFTGEYSTHLDDLLIKSI
jgi:hypothetical protein